MLLGSLVERHVAPFFSNGFVLIDKRLVRREADKCYAFIEKEETGIEIVSKAISIVND